MYINQNQGRGLLARKIGLSPPPHPPLPPVPVIYYWPFRVGASVMVYSNCQCSSAFCWSRIAWWPSAGKELFPCFSLVLFLFSVPPKLYVSISHLVLVFGAECGMRLCRFLIIVFFICSEPFQNQTYFLISILQTICHVS